MKKKTCTRSYVNIRVKLPAIYTTVYVIDNIRSKYRWGHLECSAWKYGKNCVQNCSENCYISKTCDRKSGACHGGCVIGWKLPFCNEGTCIFFLKSTTTFCSLLLSFYFDYFL